MWKMFSINFYEPATVTFGMGLLKRGSSIITAMIITCYLRSIQYKMMYIYDIEGMNR